MVLPPEKPTLPITKVNASTIYPELPKYGAAPISTVKITPNTVYQYRSFFLMGILSAIIPRAGAVTATKTIAEPNTKA